MIAAVLLATNTGSQAVDTLSPSNLVTLRGHKASIKKLAWTPGGRLISGDSEGNVFVWDPTKKNDLHHYQAGVGFIRSLDTFDSGRRYMVCVNSALLVGSVATGRQTEKMSERSGATFNRSAASSPNGKIVSVIVTGPSIIHYSTTTGKQLGEITPPGEAGSLCYARDGRLVVGSDSGREVWVYDPDKAKPAFTIPLSVGRCEDIKVSPDGKWLAAIGHYAAEVFQMRARPEPQKLEVGDKGIEALAWSADSELVVTAGANGLVQFWERRSGRLKKQLQLEIGQSTALAFSPDGRWLAIGAGDYVDMSKSPPRQEIDDKSIRLVEFQSSRKGGVTPQPTPGPEANGEVVTKLRTLQQQFDAAAARTGADAHKQLLASARKAYVMKLETEAAQAAKSGNLDLAVAIRDEKLEAQKSTQLLPLPLQTPDRLKRLREEYSKQLDSLIKNRLEALQPLFDKYDQALAAYQDDLTRHKRLDDALQIKERRERLAKERKGDVGL